MISVDQHVAQWNGRYADFDGWYGSQCVDQFNFYNRDVVGAGWIGTPLTGGAKDLWNANSAMRDKYYKKIPSSFKAQKGDVAVYSGALKGSGGYGHVETVLVDNVSSLTVFAQNWGVPYCRKVTHAKTALYGYLRPLRFIASAPAPVPVPTTNARYLYLPASARTWGIYKTNVIPVTKNIFAYLSPAYYGGLRYQVLGYPYGNVVTIQTQMFGKVNIYVGSETGARILSY
jgi:hypothetical protein